MKPWLLFLCMVFTTAVNAENFKIRYTFDKNHPPGNLAVTKSGRVFMTQHFFYGVENKLVEVLKNGKVKPYPNAKFSRDLNATLGVVADEQGILWLLETADGHKKAGRLIGWNTETNQLYKMIYLAAPLDSRKLFFKRSRYRSKQQLRLYYRHRRGNQFRLVGG